MRKKTLAGSQVFWIVQSKSYLDDAPNILAFRTKREAEHFIDHRVEGYDGWRLLQTSAFAEYVL